MALRDLLTGKRPVPVGTPKIAPPPEIDFSELWREPEDGGGMGILSIVQVVLLSLILILGFFHL